MVDMQKREGVLDRGPTSVRGVLDRTADEMPRSVGDREKIWVFSSVEVEFKRGNKIPAYEPFGLEAQYLNRAREMVRRAGGQMVEYPRGVKPLPR